MTFDGIDQRPRRQRRAKRYGLAAGSDIRSAGDGQHAGVRDDIELNEAERTAIGVEIDDEMVLADAEARSIAGALTHAHRRRNSGHAWREGDRIMSVDSFLKLDEERVGVAWTGA